MHIAAASIKVGLQPTGRCHRSPWLMPMREGIRPHRYDTTLVSGPPPATVVRQDGVPGCRAGTRPEGGK